ncbi:transporter substrate-binding domain-containing protein [Streptomyces sp. L7]
MQYLDASNKIVGMRVDLGNEIAKLLCLTPKFVNIPFDAQIPGVQSGRWDMIDTGMFYTPERAKTVKLVPYEVQGVSISVAKGNPKKITSEDDLSGKTIAVEARATSSTPSPPSTRNSRRRARSRSPSAPSPPPPTPIRRCPRARSRASPSSRRSPATTRRTAASRPRSRA